MRLNLLSGIALLGLTPYALAQSALPFSYTVETFQDKDDSDIRAFVVKLEQPFLAEEFEKSNYLRLKALDDSAFLIYPRETRFEQKHAEFYGRLRGDGKAVLQLSYETISENPDGSRKVNNRKAQIEVEIPAETTGVELIYRKWAARQNQHFANLLEYYPNESFFEYLLLQSKERYGVTPPTLSRLMPNKEASEEGLYRLFSSGLDLQRSLQRSSLRSGVKQEDLTIHISSVKQPVIQSLDYKALLQQQTEEGIQPQTHAAAALIPHDQYLLQFNTINGADGIRQLVDELAEPLFRLFTEDAQDHHLLEKYESQLLMKYDDLAPLFEDKTLKSLAVTGSDFFVAEGTDVTLLLQAQDTEKVKAAMNGWAASATQERPDMEDREFNYRGLQIRARYTSESQNQLVRDSARRLDCH